MKKTTVFFNTPMFSQDVAYKGRWIYVDMCSGRDRAQTCVAVRNTHNSPVPFQIRLLSLVTSAFCSLLRLSSEDNVREELDIRFILRFPAADPVHFENWPRQQHATSSAFAGPWAMVAYERHR